jgi:hypothetical protein
LFSLYRQVAVEAGRRAFASWPVLLVLPVYPIILYVTMLLTGSLGMIGSLIASFVLAACWSSYLELISQAVTNARFRLDWEEFKRTFAARLWDVVSVLFVFWMIDMASGLLTRGPNGPAISAIIGFAIAFFFNAVPELLYQGNSRSVALLADSARFVTEFPVVWLLPNVLLALLALAATGGTSYYIANPTALLVAFGNMFSSPMGAVAVLLSMPVWLLPLALIVAHAMMVFRGVLFRELASGRGNRRMQAFRAKSRD